VRMALFPSGARMLLRTSTAERPAVQAVLDALRAEADAQVDART
jgi:hypothetical protein